MIAEILSQDGAVVNTIVADAAFLDAAHPGRWREVELEASLETRRAELREAVRAKRKAVESGGTSLNGIPLSTDESSMIKSNGAVSLFANDPSLSVVDFEAAPGLWVSLDRATMTAVAVKIGRHIQGAFSRARALDEEIVTSPDADLDSIDINEGWPTGS